MIPLQGVRNQFSKQRKRNTCNACIPICTLTLYIFYVRSRKGGHTSDFDIMDNDEWEVLFGRAADLYDVWVEQNPYKGTSLPTLEEIIKIDVVKESFCSLFSKKTVKDGMSIQPVGQNYDGDTLLSLFEYIRVACVNNYPRPVCTILILPVAKAIAIFARRLQTDRGNASFLIFDSHGEKATDDCTLHEFLDPVSAYEHLIHKHNIWTFTGVEEEFKPFTTETDIAAAYSFYAHIFIGK